MKTIEFRGEKISREESYFLKKIENITNSQFNTASSRGGVRDLTFDISDFGTKQIMLFRVKRKRVTELILSNCRLEFFPRPIFNLKHLRRLDVKNNNISEIPREIGDLTNLEVLKLNGNNLTKIPESIGNLKSLKTLSLFDNHLLEIPDSIGLLNSLKYLHLHKNNLKSLPKSLLDLKNLSILNYGNNPLETDPQESYTLREIKAKVSQKPKKVKKIKYKRNLNYKLIYWIGMILFFIGSLLISDIFIFQSFISKYPFFGLIGGLFVFFGLAFIFWGGSEDWKWLLYSIFLTIILTIIGIVVFLLIGIKI